MTAISRLLALPLLLVATTLSFAQSENRQVQISQVDFETGVLEVTNFASTDIDLSGWRFCTHDSNQGLVYSSTSGLNGVTIGSGESVFIHFENDAPAGQPNRLNRSAVGSFALPLDRDAYELQFFFPGASGSISFGNSSLIADALQWNLGGVTVPNRRTDQAVSEGLWTSISDFIATESTTEQIRLLDTTGGLLHGPADYSVEAPRGPGAPFVRGDCNQDGSFNLADAVRGLEFLFGGGSTPDCESACDSNDDGALNVADAIFTLESLFGGGPLPGAPMTCGVDPTPDSLTCKTFSICP